MLYEVITTGAGHDAGILAAHIPTAMLFVRNPDGVSHWSGGRMTGIRSWMVAMRSLGGPVMMVVRITSYNVCYTKLLRIEISGC